MDTILRAALHKLRERQALAASDFTSAQRQVLDRFGRQTGAVQCQRQGRGEVYRVVKAQLLEQHLRALSPQFEMAATDDLPLRAQHIAFARDSKARGHQHDSYYPLLKAVGESVIWRHAERGCEHDLSRLSQDFGAASLRLEREDTWQTLQPLWLVENQALFDRTDWLPAATQATVLYYGGQLDGRLLAWLSAKPRASRVILFADYDGVGLANFLRLHQALSGACTFWLMPDWDSKLMRYGNSRLWRATLREFPHPSIQLPDDLRPLAERMQELGLALEQEAVWLPVP
jgi:hypothetical protein